MFSYSCYHFCSSTLVIRSLVTMENNSHVSNNVSTLIQIAGTDANNAGPITFHDHQPAAYQPTSGFQPDASAVMLSSSNDIEAPINMTAANFTGWAAKEEWTKHEADIKQLYVHEKKSLKEVKRLMESRHGFRATSVPRAVLLISSI